MSELVVNGGPTCASTRSGVYCWGGDNEGAEPTLVTTQALSQLQIVTGSYLCGVDPAGAIQCAGSWENAWIFEIQRALPHPVTSLAARRNRVCATTTAQDAWCWGDGTGGALGNGDPTVFWYVPEPQQVGAPWRD